MRALTVFLAGDVMTGRGIDQILPYPGEPQLFEPFVTSAETYVQLAEAANGPIPRPVDFDYIWGDLHPALEAVKPDARIVNLETAITRFSEPCPKGINYRMNPANVPCLKAAGIDCCVLANNHVLDWEVPGLEETLDTLQRAGFRTAGAGRDLQEAAAPAEIEVGKDRRVLVFAVGAESSGIPFGWAAERGRPGVNLVDLHSHRPVAAIAETLQAIRRPGDLVVVSVHWGPNWGYAVPRHQTRFAHDLIDHAGADIVHGHSSHHPKAIEVYRGRLVLYGCGDLLNDYEGISGQEEFRGDLVLAYFPTISPDDGSLRQLEMKAFRLCRFRLMQAAREEAGWLASTLTREGRHFGTRVSDRGDGTLTLDWS